MGKNLALFFAFFLLIPALSLAASPKTAPKAAPAEATAEPAQNDLAPDVEGKTSSGLPIPRFVSLGSEKVFVRTGPALRYPIKWVYQREHMPVEIIQEFDTWRKIRDMDGDDGWVHQSLLSGARSGIVKGEAKLSVHKDPDANSSTIVYFEPNVVVSLDKCHGLWCKVSAQGYDGWAERKFLWGIYADEDFD